MGSKISHLIFLLHSFFLLQCLQTTHGHLKSFEHIKPETKTDVYEDDHLRLRGGQYRRSNGIELHGHSSLDPQLQVFFHQEDLRVGKRMPIYFPTKDPSTSPRLLSRSESDSIPFSSSQLPHILKLFEFNQTSKQALAMKATLHHCEFPPLKGEMKFCATSLESMLDSVRGIFGPGSRFRVMTTNYLSEGISLLQNYTVSEPLVEVPAPRIVACHTLPYPYAVLYCHSQVSDNKLYRVMLVGEDGGKVEAAAICHMDTSEWDPQHVSFRVLKTTPGASPVCHFFPPDNLVWVQTS